MRHRCRSATRRPHKNQPPTPNVREDAWACVGLVVGSLGSLVVTLRLAPSGRDYPIPRRGRRFTRRKREGALAPDSARIGCQNSFSITVSAVSRWIRRHAGVGPTQGCSESTGLRTRQPHRDRLAPQGQGRTDDTLGSGTYGACGPQTDQPNRAKEGHRSDKPTQQQTRLRGGYVHRGVASEGGETAAVRRCCSGCRTRRRSCSRCRRPW